MTEVLLGPCPVCDSRFPERYQHVAKGKKKPQVCCGRSCAAILRARREFVPCDGCGDLFLRRWASARFCSVLCAQPTKGQGRIRHGYRQVQAPWHPKAKQKGYVWEHRWVMERSLGRFLRDDEVVHHINENRRDNRLENLQVMTVSEHARWHMPKGEFIQIRIDAAEKARWQEAAEQAGGSLSEAIRLVMNEKLGTLSEPGASLVEHAPTGLQAVSPGPESVPAKKTYQPDFKK